MGRVHEIIDSQSRNMIETEKIVFEVMNGIGTSLEKIEQIESATEELEESRNRIVRNVGGLSEIAEQNVESTQETCTRTTAVSDTFEQVESNAIHLKEIADDLSDTVTYFRL